MGLFHKKKSKTPEEIAAEMAEEAQQKDAASEKKESSVDTGNPKVDIELTRVKAQLEGLSEVRKANSERFSRIGEQIGELRGMILDTNRSISTIEVSATKAVDLVDSVHPEKLMIEVRKQDGKIEALKANIESNEALMKDLMAEIKKMREQLNFYKGVEQVIKLNDEVKKELSEIKKVEATIERHADKVETIFLEVSKKFTDFDRFNDVTKDMQATFKAIQTDFDRLKVEIQNRADRNEIIKLVSKFNDFEKHTSNILKLLDEKTRQSKKELDSKFGQMKEQLEKKAKVKLDIKEGAPEKDLKGAIKNIFRKDDKRIVDKKLEGEEEKPAEEKKENPEEKKEEQTEEKKE